MVIIMDNDTHGLENGVFEGYSLTCHLLQIKWKIGVQDTIIGNGVYNSVNCMEHVHPTEFETEMC
jgi:hypothetical protein